MIWKKLLLSLLVAGLAFAGEKDKPPLSDESSYTVPDKYTFVRNEMTTMDLNIPAIRTMALHNELYDYAHATLETMMDVWNNTTDPFNDPQLNGRDMSRA